LAKRDLIQSVTHLTSRICKGTSTYNFINKQPKNRL